MMIDRKSVIDRRALLVVWKTYAALAVHRWLVILKHRLAKLEETDQARYHDCHEAEEFFERC